MARGSLSFSGRTIMLLVSFNFGTSPHPGPYFRSIIITAFPVSFVLRVIFKKARFRKTRGKGRAIFSKKSNMECKIYVLL
jgi:hypothetical protein